MEIEPTTTVGAACKRMRRMSSWENKQCQYGKLLQLARLETAMRTHRSRLHQVSQTR